MKRKIVAALAALSLTFSSFGFADETVLNVFSNQTVIDGHGFSNSGLQYPFLKSGDSLYMPLDYQTLRTLGFLSSWNGEKNSFRIYTSTNRNYNLRTSEVSWSDAAIHGQPSAASLEWMDHDRIEGCMIEANGILYLELKEEILSTLGWAAAYHPFLGFQMSVESSDADFAQSSESELAYYDGLSKFMMTKNADLSYEKASEYAQYIKEAALEYDVDELWIAAMLWQESWYDQNCEYKGALGLMQIMESTGRALGLSREQLFDPHLSIKYGVKYLRDQMDSFNNDIELATLAYNQGPVRVMKGTYKTWYLDDVKEKVEVIKGWFNEQGISLETPSAE